MTDSDLSSFGGLLKFFRRRMHLSQQQLAESIGVHRNAIGRWEQGDVLPAYKGIVLELVRHLHLDGQESRQLLEASLTALAPHWFVPFSRNPLFTGREEILKVLHMQLGVGRTLTPTQSLALHGLGGVGKTQIALEYAYRHALEYSAVFWIRAETEELIVSSLLHMAEVLQVPERDDKDQQRVIVAVQRWLQTHRQWLLIWDNLEESALLDHFLPCARSGAILLTTRRQAWGPLAQGVELFPLELNEGILFLLRRAKVVNQDATEEQVRLLATCMPAEYTAAADVVTIMGGLPLALDQAGAYLEETGCGLPGYLSQYKRQQVHLLDQRGNFPDHHPHSVTMTFHLSMKQVEQELRVAADILRVCALLQVDAIPEELFEEGAGYLGPEFAGFFANPTRLDAALATLRRWSLIERQAQTRMLSLHRLVQVVLKEEMSETIQRTWMTRIFHTLTQLFPDNELKQAGDLRRCERLLSHALVSLAWPEHEKGQEQKRLALMNHVATYLRLRARFAEAEALYLRALQIGEQTPWSDHLLVVETLEGLADLHTQQVHFAIAESFYQQAIQIQEHILGNEHLQVAKSLSKLALLFGRQARYAEAEALYRRALPIQEQALGSEHPEIATSLSGLALVLCARGKYAEAEGLYQRALSINEQAWGGEHATVAITLRNLADLSLDQGKYEAAKLLYQRALTIIEQVWGPEDTDVGLVLNGLANLSCKVGKDKAAESFFRRALRIWETGFGPKHPHVAEPLLGLANLAWKQGKAEQAEQLFQRALSLQEQHLGLQHPQLANTLHDLALFRQKQGNLSEALSLAKRALTIRSQVLGNEHSSTIATCALSAQLLLEPVDTTREATCEQSPEELEDATGAKRHAEETIPTFSTTEDLTPSQNDPLQAFLDACCELHPRAWCRSADLWQTYEQWAKKHQERFTLSRGAFIAQLKVHGCRADRTKTARIWCGIALLKHDDGG